MPPPESGADDRDRILSRSLFLLICLEESADNRPDTQHIEKIPGNKLAPDALRLVVVPETQSPLVNASTPARERDESRKSRKSGYEELLLSRRRVQVSSETRRCPSATPAKDGAARLAPN